MDARFAELLPDLALFVAIADADSLSAASRATGIPVARLSRRLAALEQAIGIRLVERTSRSFDLTRDGEAYLTALKPPIEAAVDAFVALSEGSREPRGTLRLTTSPDFGAGFLAGLIAEFSALYPQIAIDVDLSPRLLDIGPERIDAAIRVGPLADSDLTSRRFATIPAGLYAAPAYLAAHGRPTHPAELTGHRCLTMPHMQGRAVLSRDGEQCDVTLAGPIKANNLLMLRRLCGDGMGIAMLNPTIATEGAAHCPVERVLPDWSLEPAIFYFLTPGRFLPARTRAFFDFARRRLAANGY